MIFFYRYFCLFLLVECVCVSVSIVFCSFKLLSLSFVFLHFLLQLAIFKFLIFALIFFVISHPCSFLVYDLFLFYLSIALN